jgi:hypothetical protein
MRLYLETELIVGAEPAGVANVMAQADALFRAIVLAQITNVAVVPIGDYGLVLHWIKPDHIHRAR